MKKEVCDTCRYYTNNSKHDTYRCRMGSCPAQSITTTLEREDVLNLIRGLPTPYGGNEYTKFTGNQWNESWSWDMDTLKRKSTIGLMDFYNQQKERT